MLSSATVVESDAQTERLLALAVAGDADAFGQLCRIYQTRVFRQAMLLAGNVSTAEELAQETLIEAWKGLRGFNGGCRFFTWLCAILLNRYRNSVRAKRPIPLADLDTEQETFQNRLDTEGGAGPDEIIQHRELQIRLRQCLESLPRKQQQVIYLRFYTGESLEGIAAALGCSVGTVKSRLFYGLERLRGMNVLSGERVGEKFL
ncbi:MAG: sigma-70 family RNA polymerase sigma factor [Limisphaerales bacterium]